MIGAILEGPSGLRRNFRPGCIASSVRAASQVPSGLQPSGRPSAAVGLIADPVMQTVVALLPELIGPGSDPPASPPRWPGHDLIGKLCSSGGHLGIEGGPSLDRSALVEA